MRKHSCYLALIAIAVQITGCRCGPSEESLPKPSASPAPVKPIACPPRPAWAGPLADTSEVELLHSTKMKDRQHGAGYRLHLDGDFETYDELNLQPDEKGKLTFKRVPGEWKSRGHVTEKGLGALRRATASVVKKEFEGRKRGKTSLKTAMTHITLRRDGSVISHCYVGQTAPSVSQDIVDKVHDLMNHLATKPDAGKP